MAMSSRGEPWPRGCSCIEPPSGSRANASRVRVDSAESCKKTLAIATPTDGASASIGAGTLGHAAIVRIDKSTATRQVAGAASLRISSHFPPIEYSKLLKPVTLPPGRARLGDKAGADRIGDPTKTIGNGCGVCLLQVRRIGVPMASDHIGRLTEQIAASRRICVRDRRGEAILDLDVAALDPSQFRASPLERRARRGDPDRSRHQHQQADRAASARGCCARAASGHAAAAPPSSVMNSRRYHSITSSARTSIDGGMSRPSALAVFRLRTVSYLVGACTGSSAALAPRRMRST